MIYPNADKLDVMTSKYGLVIIAAKRARQVKEGARRYVSSKSTNPLTVALEEISEGDITSVLVGEPEKLPVSVPATAVLTGLVATSIEDDETLYPSAAEIGALLSSDEELAAFGSDIETNDDAEEVSYGLELPVDEGADPEAEDAEQDAEENLSDDEDNDEE